MWKQLQKKYLGSTIPLVNVHGTINAENTEVVHRTLKKIKPSRAVALAVSVDSPGGSPVQSLLISNKIKQYASQHNLKVFTFARTLAASGGYFVLCTGDHVCADKSSLIGSIGVIFPKLKLNGLLDMTSVQNKFLSSKQNSIHQLLNPFKQITDQQKQGIIQLCDNIHTKFIKHVKTYRKDKLKDDGNLFTGQIFNGQEGLNKGLVDQVGSMVEILEKYYPGSKIQPCNLQNKVLTRMMGL